MAVNYSNIQLNITTEVTTAISETQWLHFRATRDANCVYMSLRGCQHQLGLRVCVNRRPTTRFSLLEQILIAAGNFACCWRTFNGYIESLWTYLTVFKPTNHGQGQLQDIHTRGPIIAGNWLRMVEEKKLTNHIDFCLTIFDTAVNNVGG